MRNCGCEIRLENMLLERFTEHKPDWINHTVSINGYMTGLTKDLNIVRTMGTQFVCTGVAPVRGGGTKVKKITQEIVFSFCPWCGVNLGVNNSNEA